MSLTNLGAKIAKIFVYALPFTNGLSKLSINRFGKNLGFFVTTYTV